MDNGFMGEAGKALGHRMSRFGSLPYVLLSVVSILSGCLGGSDGVENPKMELDFQPSEGAAVPGRVSLYGKNLNPAEDDTPILAKDMPADGIVSFSPEEMDAAVRRILARNGKDTSALKDTTLNFNVVATAGDKEAFVSGFSYRRAGAVAGFAKIEGSKPGPFGSFKSRFRLPKAVKGFSGRMGIYGIGLGIDYIFIPGSPYHADIDRKDSSFTVPQMGEGSYSVIGADKDSAQLFESTDTLNTTDTAYSAKTWSTITFIPDK
jgi:hypothetical protein